MVMSLGAIEKTLAFLANSYIQKTIELEDFSRACSLLLWNELEPQHPTGSLDQYNRLWDLLEAGEELLYYSENSNYNQQMKLIAEEYQNKIEKFSLDSRIETR